MNECGHDWHVGLGCPIHRGTHNLTRIAAIKRHTTKDQYDRLYFLTDNGGRVRLDSNMEAHSQLNRAVDRTHTIGNR